MTEVSFDDYEQGNVGTPASSGNAMSFEDYEQQQGVEPESEGGFLSSMGDKAMAGLDYISNPVEGPDLNTHNIRKEGFRKTMDRERKAPTRTPDVASFDEDYIQTLTQNHINAGVVKGESIKVLRDLEAKTGKKPGPRESLLVRRYLKDPDTKRGIGPGDALARGTGNLVGGLARTAGGFGTMVADAAGGLGLENVSRDLKDVSQDVSAWGDAYLSIDKDRIGSNPVGEIGAAAPLLVGNTIPTAFSAAYSYGRGQGMAPGQSAVAGAVDAGLVGSVNGLVKLISGGSVTADDLAKKGIKALDKKWVLTDKRDLIKRIEDTTGKSADKALKDVAEYMKTLDTTSMSEDQVVRMVVQNMTGGKDFSPRAGKYLGKTESLDSATAPKLMQEAQARTDDIRSTVNNPQIQEMIESFTTKHGNFEATDWEGLRQGLKDMGLPEDGPMMERITRYSEMDDVTLLRQMQGANPVSNQRLSNVGQRGDWGAQAEAEYMDKIRQFVYSHIPGVNKDEKIVKSITKSLKKGNLNPSTLRKVMVESGVNPTGLTDEALQEVIDAGPVPDVGSGRPMPRNTFGDATRPEDAAPLIDEAELDARLDRNRPGDFEGQARAEQEASVEGIINEFSTYGDKLDDALQSGMDLNLQGNALRKHVRDTLVGDDATAQSSNTVGGAVFGSTAGLEQNDDGSITWDPVKGFAGAAVGGTLANKGGRKLLAEGAVKGVDAANEALGMPNMRPGIIPSNSTAYKEIKTALGEGKFGETAKDLEARGWSKEDISEAGRRSIPEVEGNEPSYDIIAKGIEGSKLLPNQPMAGDMLKKALKSRGVTDEELKLSGFNKWVDEQGDRAINKDEVARWWDANAGKELPLSKRKVNPDDRDWSGFRATDLDEFDPYPVSQTAKERFVDMFESERAYLGLEDKTSFESAEWILDELAGAPTPQKAQQYINEINSHLNDVFRRTDDRELKDKIMAVKRELGESLTTPKNYEETMRTYPGVNEDLAPITKPREMRQAAFDQANIVRDSGLDFATINKGLLENNPDVGYDRFAMADSILDPWHKASMDAVDYKYDDAITEINDAISNVIKHNLFDKVDIEQLKIYANMLEEAKAESAVKTIGDYRTATNQVAEALNVEKGTPIALRVNKLKGATDSSRPELVKQINKLAGKEVTTLTNQSGGYEMGLPQMEHQASQTVDDLNDVANRLNDDAFDDIIYKVDGLDPNVGVGLLTPKEIYDELKAVSHEMDRKLSSGNYDDAWLTAMNKLDRRLGDIKITKSKTDIEQGALKQLNTAMLDEQAQAPYQSAHMGTTEPAYIRTSERTENGNNQLVLHEPQSDVFAAGDKFGIKASKRMPHGSDWLEKDLEDFMMKGLRGNYDEVVIPLKAANSRVDFFPPEKNIKDAVKKGEKAGWDESFWGSKQGKKLANTQASPGDYEAFPVDAPTGAGFRDAGGKGSKGVLGLSESSTTPLYYNKIVVNQIDSLAQRMGIPKEAIKRSTVGNTENIVIDMKQVPKEQVFSIYGKPGDLGQMFKK